MKCDETLFVDKHRGGIFHREELKNLEYLDRSVHPTGSFIQTFGNGPLAEVLV